MWSAFRLSLSPSITFASVVVISFAAILAASVGGGSFMGASNEEMIELQLFIAILAISMLMLQGQVLERRTAEQRLRQARDHLDATVHTRTQELKRVRRRDRHRRPGRRHCVHSQTRLVLATRGSGDPGLEAGSQGRHGCQARQERRKILDRVELFTGARRL